MKFFDLVVDVVEFFAYIAALMIAMGIAQILHTTLVGGGTGE